ncbi:MAG: phosphate ABC transporter permease subunit PstC [Hoeflea sp.]|uniref:phosphate ABC transporter permease subunit PstC n=1 Tax=Hoeflea sp. TaxID=1940281 RepID=UPI0027320623|nr:phosphate ABC transporter permease subunit PstC [Hoeflea sp.]MDP2120973.1 phosphate ABC transporter permease subunit PstC [Hoeflea sp.]MDP3524933.1 phosphate ABC transporter permease subunit PstC [Hoeflea sp.]
MVANTFLVIFLLTIVGYVAARIHAKSVLEKVGAQMHSRPIYHGVNAAIWTGVPALIIILFWLMFQNTVINQLLLGLFEPSRIEAMTSADKSLLISEIRQIAAGRIFGTPEDMVLAAAQKLNDWTWIARASMFAVVLAACLAGVAFGLRAIGPRFRARYSVERSLNAFMIFCSFVAIFTTIGIIASLVYESYQFFSMVPAYEFFFGLRWEPQIPLRADQVAGLGAFGAIPVFVGTFVIATIAMVFAVPIGLLTAIYLTEYADHRVRATIKPLLEILAGVPTVVYGFFAVLIVAPLIRDFGTGLGLDVAPRSALAAGGVMAIMLIPFISSLSDDALAAVPRAMREGSYAMGATKGETIRKVLLPAALPGIMGGILLALSRAIGETMIVVMAAGLIASMNINPLDSVTTVTVQIVTLLIGDSAFDNPKTLSAFALGLMLFLITLVLNVLALTIVRKYREKY